uniref:Gr28b_0 protein n=1 Tax=Fopius arisanus TaxID=64838 RepID=A0A0C9PUK8_9HYME
MPIFFFLLAHFIDVASYFYLICMNLREGSDGTMRSGFVMFLGWLIIHIAEVLMTVEAVNSVIHQSNYTGNIFHQMITKYYPTTICDTAKVISLRIIQQPMKFSLYGLMDLNSSLLRSVFNAMATYFVIMIQLDIQNQSQKPRC